MKLLYDHQVFTNQYYGGISRYFCEILHQFSSDPSIDISVALRYSCNENLCSYPALNKCWSRRNNFFSDMRFLSAIQKRININALGLLFRNQKESERMIKKQDFDIFHPTYYCPYFLKHLQKKPYVLTVYDMIHELYPGYFSPRDPTAQWKKEVIEHATAIIAISESTKKDILRFTNGDPERISVIYLGNPFEFLENFRNTAIRSDLLPNEKPYLLFVGKRGGYKNFIFFITALTHILTKDQNLRVFCAGGGQFTAGELKILKDLDIHTKVRVVRSNDYILPQLYTNARAFIFPSLYEGFGLPVLEAFSCGCPVVASNTSSLPEIGGEAACYFDPHDPGSLVQALESVIMDTHSREHYIKKGRERVSEFSWKKTVRDTKTVYENVMNSS
jgi:glycosyltransferase involved in cell wall biosynthesis